MERNIRLVLSLLLAALFVFLPFSGLQESFAVQNIAKSAMVKSVGFDVQEQAQISYVSSVIDDSSAFHKQSVISASAGSFAEAEKQAQILSDKYLTLSYAKHFLIGMPSAQKGIKSVLDYLLGSNVLQLSSYVYLCEGSALAMLKRISADSISTNEVLTNLNLAGKEEGYYHPTTVLECAQALAENQCLALPLIGEKEEGVNSAKKAVLVFKGYALLQGGSVKAVLTRAQSRALNFLGERRIKTVVGVKGGDLVTKKLSCTKHFERQGDSVGTVTFRLRLQSRFVRFAGQSLQEESRTEECLREQKQRFLEEMQSLLTLLQQKQLDALDVQGALERQSFGSIADPRAALQNTVYRVDIVQKTDLNFTLR
ncbi:MAG: hypothetical protein IJJ41_00570 [Clostridia bacterium]|nr:hypothetical protein [Clostridia bacterium]